ncbi:unnamed protein product [Spirodela intermedia]|uniref:Uncharacterized protein n=1 Tax=Spirodela intermedia TaxID=51605 RepID=A0A7I8J4G3_SPIIN|nr:unnamed protein product [Spirodela intermedia]CAA6664261.1 unnamed protein product [Spirodela intermedia]
MVFRSAVPLLVRWGETILGQPWLVPAHVALPWRPSFGGGMILRAGQQRTCQHGQHVDSSTSRHVVMTIGLNTWAWSCTTNLEALLLLEASRAGGVCARLWWWCRWGSSCVFGLAISFFGFSCRRAISATGFTVLGVVNKLLTWRLTCSSGTSTPSFVGTVSLLVCMFGRNSLPAVRRHQPKASGAAAAAPPPTDEEQQRLLEMTDAGGAEGPFGSPRRRQVRPWWRGRGRWVGAPQRLFFCDGLEIWDSRYIPRLFDWM